MEEVFIYYISKNGGVPSDYGMSQLARLSPGLPGTVIAGLDYNDTKVFLDAVQKEPPYAIVIALDPEHQVCFTKAIKSQAKHVDDIVTYVKRHRGLGKGTWQLCIEFLAKNSGKFKVGFSEE